jgi:uncharacterized OB-fold protein
VTTAQPARPLPTLFEPDTAHFWKATLQNRLLYQVCTACGTTVFHPRRHCTNCTGLELEWRESAGEGSIYAFTVIRQHGHPYFRARTPYIVAFVDLDEGVRILAEVDADPAALRSGQRVSVGWEEHESVHVPVFRPAEVG